MLLPVLVSGSHRPDFTPHIGVGQVSKNVEGNPRINELDSLQDEALAGGGKKRIAAQHEKGKLTARERITALVDEGSFQELDMFRKHAGSGFGGEMPSFHGDGVITGYARIDGRIVFLYAQDFTCNGGSLSRTHAEKICKVMDMAMKSAAPVIALNDSGGARVQEGISSLAGYGEIFTRNVQSSGYIPQITAILGPCAGGAVYSPAVQDFIVMSRSNSYMFVTGPRVVKQVIFEDVSSDDLGGARVHGSKSGVAHFLTEGDLDALNTVKRLLSFLPSSNLEKPPYIPPADDPKRSSPSLASIVPVNPRIPYDVRDVIGAVVDDGDFFEVQSDYARNIIIGFTRMNGHPVGIVANQPKVLAGVLDIDASVKSSRFIRFCDAFNIPLVTFVDVPGFMPGTEQEHGGIIRHGAKMLYAYAEATVPKITVILRKAYGGAYIIMNSRHLRGDMSFAWPTAQIAVMGAKGAAEIIFRRGASYAEDPEKYLKEKELEYEEHFSNPYRAAEQGYVDEVIRPEATRPRIIMALEALKNKTDWSPAKKHGCIPL